MEACSAFPPITRRSLTDEDPIVSAPAPDRLYLPSATARPEATLTGPPRTPLGAAAPRYPAALTLRDFRLPADRSLAALCALPPRRLRRLLRRRPSGLRARRRRPIAATRAPGCHSLDGSKRTGPTFKGLAGSTVTLEGGKKVKADAAYLERAILEPDADVAEGYDAGLMKASIAGFDLKSKPEDVKRLVEFIQGVEVAQRFSAQRQLARDRGVAVRAGANVDPHRDLARVRRWRLSPLRAFLVSLIVDLHAARRG